MSDEVKAVIEQIQKENKDYSDKMIVLSNQDFFGYIKYFDRIIPSFGRLSVVPDYYETLENVYLSNKQKPKYLRVFQRSSSIVVSEQAKVYTTQVYKDMQIKYLRNRVKGQSDILKRGDVIHLIQQKDLIRGQDFYYPERYPKYSIFNIQINDNVKKYKPVNDFKKPGLYIFDSSKLLYVQNNVKSKSKPIIIA